MGHDTTHDIYARARCIYQHYNVRCNVKFNDEWTSNTSHVRGKRRHSWLVSINIKSFNNLDCNLQKDYIVKLRTSGKSRKLYFSRQTEGFQLRGVVSEWKITIALWMLFPMWTKHTKLRFPCLSKLELVDDVNISMGLTNPAQCMTIRGFNSTFSYIQSLTVVLKTTQV